jgi:hypothetical protein
MLGTLDRKTGLCCSRALVNRVFREPQEVIVTSGERLRVTPGADAATLRIILEQVHHGYGIAC